MEPINNPGNNQLKVLPSFLLKIPIPKHKAEATTCKHPSYLQLNTFPSEVIKPQLLAALSDGMNPPGHSNFLLALLLLGQVFVGVQEARERGANMEFVGVDILASIFLLLYMLSPQLEVFIGARLFLIYLQTNQ